MSPYENALRKSFLAPEQKDMPLDAYQKEQSMFSGENPYSQPEPAPIVEDLAPTEPGMVESGKMSQKQFDVASMQPGGANEVLVGAGSDALMAFGDPEMKALGLGLKTLQGISQAKQQQKMNKYNAEVRKIQARQDALNSLANIGRGLKA